MVRSGDFQIIIDDLVTGSLGSSLENLKAKTLGHIMVLIVSTGYLMGYPLVI